MSDERYYYDLEPYAEQVYPDNCAIIDWDGGESSWWQWQSREY